jgi:ABC-type branched-subunit amino acid transport system permease subunit
VSPPAVCAPPSLDRVAAWRRALRYVGLATIAVGSILFLTLLLWEPYIEPANGSLSCGPAWGSPQIEDFLVDDCQRAIDQRRVTLLFLGVVILVGIVIVVATRSRRSNVAESD